MNRISTDNPTRDISRQRRYQLRMREEGRCVLCGKKLATATHCEQHAKMHRESQLRRYYQKIRPKRYPHLAPPPPIPGAITAPMPAATRAVAPPQAA